MTRRQETSLGLQAQVSPGSSCMLLLLLLGASLALSSCGGPSPTPPRPVQTQAPAPGAPSNLRVTDRGDNFVQWQWNPVSGAAGYQVQLSIGDNTFNPPDEQANLGADQIAVRFEDDQLAPGTTVYLRVRAFSGSAASPTYGPFSGAVSGMTSGAATAPPDDDRGRLVALYVATGGEDWRNDGNWMSDRPLDEWYGVETDGEGRVVSLDLGDNDLDGQIPAELGGLSRLRAVDLGGNRLRGVIPAELGRLSVVQTVDLSENSLTGSIPPDLAEWGQLGDLDLSDNRLTGVIPVRLGSGGTVRRLDLGNNRLTGEIPPDLAEWGQLEELDLGDNELGGEIPQAFGRLSPLRTVDLGGNRLSGRIPEFSGEWMDYLENLELGHNELSGSIPATIGNAGRLTGIDLGSNRLSGSIPATIGSAGRLTAIDLGSNRLTGRIPAALGNLRNLVELDLGNDEDLVAASPAGYAAQTTGPSGNALSGSIPRELGRLTLLELLDLSGNALSGRIPGELGQLTALETLNLANNEQLSGALPTTLTALQNLENLGLNGTSLEVPQTQAFRNWLGNIPNVATGETTTQTSTGDRAALEAFFRSTRGGNWTDNTGWLRDEVPLSGWYGVTTNSDGRVTALILNGNKLAGRLPAEIGDLDQLGTLWLQNNELTGAIPRQLGDLDLESLSLYNNRLTGAIPRELGDLVNLTDLWLHNNRLTGAVPSTFGRLTQLEILALTGNAGLRGPLPEALTALTALLELSLENTALCAPTDAAFQDWLDGVPYKNGVVNCAAGTGDRAALEAFYNATDGPNWTNNTGWLTDAPLGDWFGVTTDSEGNVTEIELNENGLSGRLPPELGDLASLTGLDLEDNELSGPIPRELGQLTNLETLDFLRNQLSGQIPPELGQLANLTFLRFTYNQLSGRIPPELGQLTNLTLLGFSQNNLSGPIPPVLGQLVNLTALGFWANQLSGPIPPELGRLTNLDILYLSNNELTGTVPAELGRLTALTQLILNGNPSLTGPLPDTFLSLTMLEHLWLHDSGICVPATSAFSAWLDGIEEKRGVVNCAPVPLAALDWTGLPDRLSVEVGDSKTFRGQLSPAIDPDRLRSASSSEAVRVEFQPLPADEPVGLSEWEVTGLSAGTATVTLTAIADGYETATATIEVTVTAATGTATNRPADWAPLEALYNATDGANWDDNTGWLEDDVALEDWYGVITHSDGRVDRLDLAENGLDGTLPSKLGDLSQVRQMRLWETS